MIARYISKQLMAAVFMVLLVFLVLFTFFGFSDELPNVGKGNFKTKHAILAVIYTLPSYIYDLLPIATLIGAIYTFSQLAASSEYTIMRVSGYSPIIALKKLFLPGLLLVMLTYACGELLSPLAAQKLQELRSTTLGSKSTEELKSGIWVKDHIDKNSDASNTQNISQEVSRYVSITSLKGSNQLQGVVIREFDHVTRLTKIYRAKSADYLNEMNQWQLNDGDITEFITKSNESIPQRVTLTPFSRLMIHSALTPKLLAALLVVPQRMSAQNLYQYIKHLKENGQTANKHEIAFWKKLTYPLATFVMLILSLSFAYLHVRAGGVSLKIFMGVMIGVGFYFLNNLTAFAGALKGWNPLLVALTPSLLTLSIALFSLYWVNRR